MPLGSELNRKSNKTGSRIPPLSATRQADGTDRTICLLDVNFLLFFF